MNKVLVSCLAWESELSWVQLKVVGLGPVTRGQTGWAHVNISKREALGENKKTKLPGKGSQPCPLSRYCGNLQNQAETETLALGKKHSISEPYDNMMIPPYKRTFFSLWFLIPCGPLKQHECPSPPHHPWHARAGPLQSDQMGEEGESTRNYYIYSLQGELYQENTADAQ